MNSILEEEFVPYMIVGRKEYPFQPSALELLEEKGYKLLKRIGSGSTSFVFLALDEKEGREVAIVIPVFGSESNSLEWIIEAQTRGKLRDACTLYETFPIEGLLCEELVEEARNDKPWEDDSEPLPPLLDIHHIQVLELLVSLNINSNHIEVHQQLCEMTERIFMEGYVYTDIHSDNLAYNSEGELKFIDLVSLRVSPDEEELIEGLTKYSPRSLDIVESGGLGFVYSFYYHRILDDVEYLFTI